MQNESAYDRSDIGALAKVGAALFALWGVLHIWVGLEGVKLYLSDGLASQWHMFLGGKEVPFGRYALPNDPVTAHVQSNFILNFCLDGLGYGLLGVIAGWLIYTRGSWIAYILAVVLLSVSDLSFVVLQLIPGIFALNLGGLSGPIIWFLATVVTPFGLPAWSRPATAKHLNAGEV